MKLPKNVLWFEVLLYLSLVLDALSAAFQDRTPDKELTESTIMIANVMAAGLILLFFCFVWLAARRRKNWPRWALVASLVLSVISLVQIVGETGVRLMCAWDTPPEAVDSFIADLRTVLAVVPANGAVRPPAVTG